MATTSSFSHFDVSPFADYHHKLAKSILQCMSLIATGTANKHIPEYPEVPGRLFSSPNSGKNLLVTLGPVDSKYGMNAAHPW